MNRWKESKQKKTSDRVWIRSRSKLAPQEVVLALPSAAPSERLKKPSSSLLPPVALETFCPERASSDGPLLGAADSEEAKDEADDAELTGDL